MNRFILNSCLLLASIFFVASSSVTASDSSDSWESAESVGGDWYNLSWLGHYYAASDNWVYHAYHGWLYRPVSDTSSIWLHDQELGWIWTNQSVYPFLYQHSSQGWLYYLLSTSNPRSFYDFNKQEWLSVESTQSSGNTPVENYDWDPLDNIYPGVDWDVTDIAVNFRWKRNLKQNADGQYVAPQTFRLQVDEDPSFGTPVIDVNQTSPKPSYPDDVGMFERWSYISHMPKSLLPAGTYYWRVRVEDGNGSQWSTATSFTVNVDHTQSPLVYTLSPESPLFTFDMFFGAGTEPLIGRIPTIHEAFPESIRPYLGYAIHCEAIGQDPVHDDGFNGNFLDLIRPSAIAGVPLLIKSGGPDKDFQQFADLTEVEEIFKTYPNVIGFLLGETFWDFIDAETDATIRDRHLQWYKRSFLLAAKYGRLVIWGNGNDEDFVWDKFLGEENTTHPWMSPEEFESIAQNLVIAPKNNIPFGHFHAESAVMGAWLAGRTNNWGVWSEGWAWGSIGYDKLFGDQLMGNADDPDFSTMPYNLWIQMKLAGLSQGATVFHFGGESSIVEWGEYDALNDQFVIDDDESLKQSTAFWDMSGNEHPSLQRYILPFMKAVVEHSLIPSQSEVLSKVQLAVAAPSPGTSKGSALDYGKYAPLFLATNELPGYVSIEAAEAVDPEVEYYELVPNANRREVLRDNGRHYATPILPYPVNSLSDGTEVIQFADLTSTTAVQALVDPLYPETSTGSAWVVQVGHRLFISNGLENTDEAQDFSVQIEGLGTLSGTIQPHTYLLGSFKDGTIWFMANAGGKGTYTDDRTTRLQLSLEAKPTWNLLSGDAMISWAEGILSLELSHQQGATEVSVTMNQENTGLEDGLYAQIETSLGNIVLSLEFEKCPITVCNFVSLAEGTMTTERQGPYYDGLIFHRVIKNFMIQGGDPLGTGGGGPGYSFRDEIDFSLLHTGKGILSMANSGPATNGSQFFITHAATSWLDGKHTVFGQVVDGMDILEAIAGVAVDSSDRPTEPVTMNKVSLIRVGEKANSFETGQAAFDGYLQAKHPNETAGESHLVETQAKDGYNVTASGLVYKVIEEGTGNQPGAGSLVTVDYEGRLIDGTVFDSSYARGTPSSLYLNQVIAGFGEGVQLMKTGSTYEFHISHNLAYGESNVGLVIPAFSTIIFTVELISFQ